MAGRGPVPKRSQERTRNNKVNAAGIALKKGVALPYEWYEPGEDWPEPVVRFYESFKESGMQAFLQQTDVAQLYMGCQLLAEEWAKPRRSALLMGEAFKLLRDLGATEAERRRMQIELDTPQVQEVDAKVVAMESAKARLRDSSKE